MMDSNTTTTHAITMQGQGQPHQHHHGDRHQHRHGDGYGYRSGRRGWVVPGVVVFLSVMLVLSGCTSSGDDPSPGVTSPAGTAGETTPPTTTTAVPPPTAAVYKPASDTGPAENVPKPVLPAKAQEFSKEGLIAFTEYWYSTLGYAFETGDPEPMMTITDPGCRTCNAMKEAVVPWHEEGRWIVGGQMHVLSSDTPFTPAADGNYQVTLMVRQQNVKYYRGDKTLAEDRGVKPTVADILIATYGSGRWTAITVEHLQGSGA
ncbi:hypothetical protein SAMN04489740_1475 [Arthrobacter alpinus]|uniref:DUF6318 domain-containing protein n=1 Tax=Arthrobacter alpinus TaxID=656366 RepID=A0A1H5J1H7_9MICC|nr:DUF6318 family protein [Arthrobacter alpinus]SEE46322.1 hypothetical protein SAMN04489740_1475 [Arthrobacter alpinus]